MSIDWNNNKLTPEIEKQLVQGTKVRFKWYGNSSLIYTGRIELSKYGDKYFVNEHNYKDDVLIHENMRFYNSLDSFHHFTEFEIL